METKGIILSEGHAVVQPVMADVQVLLFGETGQVRLLLATQSHQAIMPGPGRPPSATTLAVDMNQGTATKLLQQLGNLVKKMGWPLPPEVAGQDGRQTFVSTEMRRK